jgi:hypothetical protein
MFTSNSISGKMMNYSVNIEPAMRSDSTAAIDRVEFIYPQMRINDTALICSSKGESEIGKQFNVSSSCHKTRAADCNGSECQFIK